MERQGLLQCARALVLILSWASPAWSLTSKAIAPVANLTAWMHSVSPQFVPLDVEALGAAVGDTPPVNQSNETETETEIEAESVQTAATVFSDLKKSADELKKQIEDAEKVHVAQIKKHEDELKEILQEKRANISQQERTNQEYRDGIAGMRAKSDKLFQRAKQLKLEGKIWRDNWREMEQNLTLVMQVTQKTLHSIDDTNDAPDLAVIAELNTRAEQNEIDEYREDLLRKISGSPTLMLSMIKDPELKEDAPSATMVQVLDDELMDMAKVETAELRRLDENYAKIMKDEDEREQAVLDDQSRLVNVTASMEQLITKLDVAVVMLEDLKKDNERKGFLIRAFSRDMGLTAMPTTGNTASWSELGKTEAAQAERLAKRLGYPDDETANWTQDDSEAVAQPDSDDNSSPPADSLDADETTSTTTGVGSQGGFADEVNATAMGGEGDDDDAENRSMPSEEIHIVIDDDNDAEEMNSTVDDGSSENRSSQTASRAVVGDEDDASKEENNSTSEEEEKTSTVGGDDDRLDLPTAAPEEAAKEDQSATNDDNGSLDSPAATRRGGKGGDAEEKDSATDGTSRRGKQGDDDDEPTPTGSPAVRVVVDSTDGDDSNREDEEKKATSRRGRRGNDDDSGSRDRPAAAEDANSNTRKGGKGCDVGKNSTTEGTRPEADTEDQSATSQRGKWGGDDHEADVEDQSATSRRGKRGDGDDEADVEGQSATSRRGKQGDVDDEADVEDQSATSRRGKQGDVDDEAVVEGQSATSRRGKQGDVADEPTPTASPAVIVVVNSTDGDNSTSEDEEKKSANRRGRRGDDDDSESRDKPRASRSAVIEDEGSDNKRPDKPSPCVPVAEGGDDDDESLDSATAAERAATRRQRRRGGDDGC